MFGCFPVGGFGFGGCCGFARPIIPFGGCYAPISFGAFACPNVAVVGNPFFFGGGHPFIQDNLTLQYKIFNKLGLIG